MEILELSTQLLNSIKTHPVLEVYEEYLDYFRIYSVYIINYSTALGKLSKSTIAKELSLVELQLDLLKPIQRIPQLKILFQKICINNQEERVKIILEKVLSVAKYINDSIKEHEAFVKWMNLESQLLGYPGNLSKTL